MADMNQQEIAYCETCALGILKQWKGWPDKDLVPLLPRINSGVCECCGTRNPTPLLSTSITWYAYREYDAGLPDYWLLVADCDFKDWGCPYFSEGVCPKCGGRSVISEMIYNHGGHGSKRCELTLNCPKCGRRVVRPPYTA